MVAIQSSCYEQNGPRMFAVKNWEPEFVSPQYYLIPVDEEVPPFYLPDPTALVATDLSHIEPAQMDARNTIGEEVVVQSMVHNASMLKDGKFWLTAAIAAYLLYK